MTKAAANETDRQGAEAGWQGAEAGMLAACGEDGAAMATVVAGAVASEVRAAASVAGAARAATLGVLVGPEAAVEGSATETTAAEPKVAGVAAGREVASEAEVAVAASEAAVVLVGWAVPRAGLVAEASVAGWPGDAAATAAR